MRPLTASGFAWRRKDTELLKILGETVGDAELVKVIVFCRKMSHGAVDKGYDSFQISPPKN